MALTLFQGHSSDRQLKPKLYFLRKSFARVFVFELGHACNAAALWGERGKYLRDIIIIFSP